MSKITYEQARSDHEYLWSIAPAEDMTGGYVDQGDLTDLLRNPCRAKARDIYENQIEYWFQVGPDGTGASLRLQGGDGTSRIPWSDSRVLEIARRRMIDTPGDADDE